MVLRFSVKMYVGQPSLPLLWDGISRMRLSWRISGGWVTVRFGVLGVLPDRLSKLLIWRKESSVKGILSWVLPDWSLLKWRIGTWLGKNPTNMILVWMLTCSITGWNWRWITIINTRVLCCGRLICPERFIITNICGIMHWRFLTRESSWRHNSTSCARRPWNGGCVLTLLGTGIVWKRQIREWTLARNSWLDVRPTSYVCIEI